MASLLHTKKLTGVQIDLKHIPSKWKTRQEIIFEEKFEQHKLGAHPKLSWKCRTCWIFNIHYSTFKADQVYIPSLAVSVNICLYQSEYIMRKAVSKFPRLELYDQNFVYTPWWWYSTVLGVSENLSPSLYRTSPGRAQTSGKDPRRTEKEIK